MNEDNFVLEGKNILTYVNYIMPNHIPVASANKSVIRNIFYDIEIHHKKINENLYNFVLCISYTIGSKCKAYGTNKQKYKISGIARKTSNNVLKYSGNGNLELVSPKIYGRVFISNYNMFLDQMIVTFENSNWNLKYLKEYGFQNEKTSFNTFSKENQTLTFKSN